MHSPCSSFGKGLLLGQHIQEAAFDNCKQFFLSTKALLRAEHAVKSRQLWIPLCSSFGKGLLLRLHKHFFFCTKELWTAGHTLQVGRLSPETEKGTSCYYNSYSQWRNTKTATALSVLKESIGECIH